MKYYCRSGRIVATHTDEQDVAASTYDLVNPDETVTLACIISVPDGLDEYQIGGVFQDITPEILAATMETAKRRVVIEADKLADVITGQVPRGERDSWVAKAAAARAHFAETAEDWQISMLQTEADLRAETIDVLAAKIVAAASSYETVSAMIAAQRAKTFAAIDATETPEQIEVALRTAAAEAASMLATVQGA